MPFLDILTIVLFATGILCTGLLFAKRGKNMKSFFAAGGSVPWAINGLSLFMGFFSAGTFVVWGSIAYSLGWVSVTIQWTMAIAGFLVGLFIAPYWHKTGALTVAEYINNQLGLKTQKVYTLLFLLISLFTTGSFLYPVAKIVEVSTGLPLSACILLLGGVCIIYVAVGGLWAVVVTDVLQFVILTAAVIIVIPLAFDKIGSFTDFVNNVPGTFFNPINGEYSIGFIIAFGIYNAIFLGGNWAYVQRYTSVRTNKDARKVGFLFGGLYLISPVLWMLPPMLYRAFSPGLQGLENEGAYLMMCKEALPLGLLGMMLGGMIFATASSLNATLNISSGVFTNDVYKRLFPNSNDKTLIRVARLSTIAFGVLAIIVALLIPLMGGIVNVVISVAALTGVPLYLPVIWTLFSKRQTGTSIIATTLLSLGVNALFKFITPALFNFSLTRAEEMILGVLFPALILIFFEIYYKLGNKTSILYDNYKRWEESNNKAKTSEAENTKDSSQADNRFSIRVIGFGILAAGLLILILGIIADFGNVMVTTTGICLMILGFSIQRKN